MDRTAARPGVTVLNQEGVVGVTAFEKDMVRVLCGSGASVLAGRRQVLASFRDELNRCKSPFRREVLVGEVRRLEAELASLKEQYMLLKNKQAASKRKP